MLALSCSNGRLAVALAWPAFPGLDEARVDASVDGGKVHAWTFTKYNTPGAPLMFDSRGDWRRFTSAIAGGDTLAIRVHGYQGTQETTFKLRDADAHVAAVASACVR